MVKDYSATGRCGVTEFTDSLQEETKRTKRAVDVEGDGTFMVYDLGFEVRGSRGKAAASCAQSKCWRGGLGAGGALRLGIG